MEKYAIYCNYKCNYLGNYILRDRILVTASQNLALSLTNFLNCLVVELQHFSNLKVSNTNLYKLFYKLVKPLPLELIERIPDLITKPDGGHYHYFYFRKV